MRDVRQDDPLSQDLFITCAEFLADARKQNGQIKRITINNDKFLLEQYADYNFFLLDGTSASLSLHLDNLELFGECSGLKVNVQKTKAVWLSSKPFSKELTYCFHKKILTF